MIDFLDVKVSIVAATGGLRALGWQVELAKRAREDLETVPPLSERKAMIEALDREIEEFESEERKLREQLEAAGVDVERAGPGYGFSYGQVA